MQHRLPPELLQRAREMRTNGSSAEQVLWWCLRSRRLDGLKFKRQVPIGRYIDDFYCAEQSLIVELDGESHDERQDYDDERTAWLNARGYRVVRFLNEDVFATLDDVLRTIARECGRETSTW